MFKTISDVFADGGSAATCDWIPPSFTNAHRLHQHMSKSWRRLKVNLVVYVCPSIVCESVQRAGNRRANFAVRVLFLASVCRPPQFGLLLDW